MPASKALNHAVQEARNNIASIHTLSLELNEILAEQETIKQVTALLDAKHRVMAEGTNEAARNAWVLLRTEDQLRRDGTDTIRAEQVMAIGKLKADLETQRLRLRLQLAVIAALGGLEDSHDGE